MHPAVIALVKSLSQGQAVLAGESADQADTVSQIASIYEIARNALEYRAQHLVRRAAIERIIAKHAAENTEDHAWLVGLISAEIKDAINPNPDYNRFTY